MPCDHVYTLTPETTACSPQAAQPVAQTLAIAEPTAPARLHGTQMLYRRAPFETDRYALNRWCDAPAQMLQSFMLKNIECTGLFRHVASAGTARNYDYKLAGEIDAFRQDFNAEDSQGVLDIKLYLIDRNGRIVASKRFHYRIKASSPDAEGGVDALNRATQRFGRDLCAWLHTTLTKEAK
jgi:ABC-type uncharacterized transport system auxiliary subunit